MLFGCAVSQYNESNASTFLGEPFEMGGNHVVAYRLNVLLHGDGLGEQVLMTYVGPAP